MFCEAQVSIIKMAVSQVHFAISHLKSLGDAVNLGSRALLVLGLRLRELPLLALRRQAAHHRPGQQTQQQRQKLEAKHPAR